jgi:hypothetical protein
MSLRILCSYRRRPVVTRNNAGIFVQSSQPTLEVFLDVSGDNFRWAIQSHDRVVYRMLPNPLDPDYVSYPSFEGSWTIENAMPGM